MNAAISVKSPFSHNALFGFIFTPPGLNFPFPDCVVNRCDSHCRRRHKDRLDALAPRLAGQQMTASPPSDLQLCNARGARSMPYSRDRLLERLRQTDSFAGGPGKFAGSPEGAMDAFSEILSGVKLNGALFFTAEFSAPWGFSAPASNVLAATIAPGAGHMVVYHLLIEGGALIELADGQLVELNPGDVVIFPHGDAHHMSSGKGAGPPFPNYGINAKIRSRDLSPLHAGGSGDTS